MFANSCIFKTEDRHCGRLHVYFKLTLSVSCCFLDGQFNCKADSYVTVQNLYWLRRKGKLLKKIIQTLRRKSK